MGCDIHLFKEKFVAGKWESADKWTPYDYGPDERGVTVDWKDRFSGRNYALFGLLAKGVRRDCAFAFAQRGVPFDASPEIVQEVGRYGDDGHSHSYLFLHELKAMQEYIKTATTTVSGMKDSGELVALQESIKSGSPNWDLLYPYCQGTTNRSYVRFTIEVPAGLQVAEALTEIIAGFDGIDGENHRIVFYFDN